MKLFKRDVIFLLSIFFIPFLMLAQKPRKSAPIGPVAPPPSDVQSFKTQAKSSGAKSFDVHCISQRCFARVTFADGSFLFGKGPTRQAAMNAIDFTKPHPAPTVVKPAKESYEGTL